MKFSGGKKDGQHLSKNIGKNTGNGSGGSRKKPVRKGRKKLVRFVTVFFLVIVAVVSFVYAYYKAAVQPPPVKSDPRRPSATTPPDGSDPSGSLSPVNPNTDTSERPPLVYTFLVIGTDDGNGNTDTIMVMRFDATNYTLNIVNIPRDTLVNVSWSLKKVNSIYSNERAAVRKNSANEKEITANAMKETVDKFKDILGFEVDYYVLVDMKAFVKLIDAVGGVDYTMPRSMNYDDPAQNLSIHFNKGQTYHFSGSDALKVMRFRLGNDNSGYVTGDIGRIEFQQAFLSSTAEQVLAKRNSLNIAELADIFLNYVKTDMTLNHLLWFGKEALKLDAENISFATMPADYYGDSIYVIIDAEEWLKLLNEKISPFSDEITEGDLSIYTRGSNGKLYITDGNAAGTAYKGSSGGSSSSGNSSSSGSSASSGGAESNGNSASSGGSPPQGESTAEPVTPQETPANETPADADPPDNATENPEDTSDYPSQLGPPPETDDTTPADQDAGVENDGDTAPNIEDETTE